MRENSADLTTPFDKVRAPARSVAAILATRTTAKLPPVSPLTGDARSRRRKRLNSRVGTV
jgi:hypothetical protein